ncbi:MAG: aryl-sulfate sulfotransferase [Flavobacteriales bacterium]|nr:aryl-sulfate sulfotransferase [Flavobacteriales bacterium]
MKVLARPILSATTSFILCAGVLRAQNTVGLLQYDQNTSYEGYTLYYPTQQSSAYLLNNCGQVVHAWPDSLLNASNSMRLMNDGGIQRCAIAPNVQSLIFAGGAGQYVQRKDWNNNITWLYEYNNASVRMHHDACLLPNGNTLIVAWESKTILEAWQAGRDTAGFGFQAVWPDHLIEVEPTGATTGNIVWEWHAWDHLVQDFNPLANNYGVVEDNAQLIDINYDEALNPDWMHVNYVEYNPVLDQIVISVPHFNELWVIDHSTTTAEAASHAGGNSGRGGDLLYRWGNPQAYRQGTIADKRLFFNHGTAWAKADALPGDPDFGRIIVFNNRLGNASSAVDIVNTPVDANGDYTYQQGTPFGPPSHSWRYEAPVPTDFFSGGLGNAQMQPNGNVLVCSGRQGWLFEVDPLGNMVWQYESPVVNGNPVAQYTMPPGTGNQVFHVNRYPADHPGLVGQVLNPIGYVELNPDTLFCSMPMTVEPVELPAQVQLLTNVVSDQVVVIGAGMGTPYAVLDRSGRAVLSGTIVSGQQEIAVRALTPGLYVLKVADVEQRGQKFVVVR